ncbi:MAG: hypothetical protein ACOCUU_00170 [Nanoarchaeota archaeon]
MGNKKNKWKIGFIFLFIILIALGILAFGYHQTALEKKYIEGGKDALTSIVSAINSSGGVTLTLEDNQTISIARYEK